MTGAAVAGGVPVGAPPPARSLLAVAGAGWLGLLALGTLDLVGGHGDHAALGMHALGSLAMVAVMAPLVASDVRYAATGSPAPARGRIGREVVAGWALVWVVVAVVLGAASLLARAAIGALGAIGLATAVAVGWQHTAAKRRSLARCHRAVGRFGVRLGVDCALSCWALMALMAAAGHDPLIAAATVGVAWHERRRPFSDPGTTEISLAIVAIGATAAVLAVLGG